MVMKDSIAGGLLESELIGCETDEHKHSQPRWYDGQDKDTIENLVTENTVEAMAIFEDAAKSVDEEVER